MKELRQMTFVALVAILALVAFPAIGLARNDVPGDVPAPTGFECTQVDDEGDCPVVGYVGDGFTGVCTQWIAATGATKYSIDFRCTMDSQEVEFSFGTGDDRTDLFISFDDLNTAASFASAGAITDLGGWTCEAKVKGLNPGHGNGRQNNTFSEPPADCGMIPGGV